MRQHINGDESTVKSGLGKVPLPTLGHPLSNHLAARASVSWFTGSVSYPLSSHLAARAFRGSLASLMKDLIEAQA